MTMVDVTMVRVYLAEDCIDLNTVETGLQG
ncbi:MAG: hypothetical protein ACI9QV_000994 [Methylophagaceae bacterium]|jgi:hypothetical protein